ncbi:adenosylmethionine--8-amino-7-oxononanoate transaminase [Verrucomicrobia bacterium LW23]|nr:adenosylmethionine--8-amino-7-oxononanoate transaminase [Verrucomicrobia bacterium LW23]
MAADKSYCWHPFTPNATWLSPDFAPIVIAEAEGAELVDSQGHRYLDGNSSIWTNLHGHRHPYLNAALKAQIDRISHSSFLGLTNDRAPLLAERLIRVARNGLRGGDGGGDVFSHTLQRCFYSDDGATAMEAAIKIVHQHWRQLGETRRTRYISLSGGYHGDTVGAMSIGHSATFHHHYGGMLFPVEEVRGPDCYRCPHNRAKPEREDTRMTRKCAMECVRDLERAVHGKGVGPGAGEGEPAAVAALILEPRVQGAAGMIMHPEGYLAHAARIAREAEAKLILDEVMTGFCRTGPLFAFQHEQEPDVRPDAVALAKGLTGGYLPMAATLIAEPIFQAFSGGPDRAFYHGHSYTANQLGCAVADASLDLLEAEGFMEAHRQRISILRTLAQVFWTHPNVGDVRQEGLILAVELVEDFETRRPFAREKRLGWHVCERARRHGLLTRGIGDVLVLMPPYCCGEAELQRMVEALFRALYEVIPADVTS